MNIFQFLRHREPKRKTIDGIHCFDDIVTINDLRYCFHCYINERPYTRACWDEGIQDWPWHKALRNFVYGYGSNIWDLKFYKHLVDFAVWLLGEEWK